MLETNEGSQTLGPACARASPPAAATPIASSTRAAQDAVILVVGDRTPFDEITYPDIDNHAKAGADGKYVYTQKDGSPH